MNWCPNITARKEISRCCCRWCCLNTKLQEYSNAHVSQHLFYWDDERKHRNFTCWWEKAVSTEDLIRMNVWNSEQRKKFILKEEETDGKYVRKEDTEKNCGILSLLVVHRLEFLFSFYHGATHFLILSLITSHFVSCESSNGWEFCQCVLLKSKYCKAVEVQVNDKNYLFPMFTTL